MTYFEDGFLETSRRQFNTSKCRCHDEDTVFHCWNAGLHTKRFVVILETENRDGRDGYQEDGDIASKWRSFDVILVAHCLNAG